MTAIDYLGYPHIIDVLFDHCSRPALLALRGACKLWKARADDLLARHTSLSTCPEGDMVVQAYDQSSRSNGPARLPALMSYYLDILPDDGVLLDLLAPSVRVITFEPGVRITRRNAFFWSLPNVRMILDSTDAKVRSQVSIQTVQIPLCDVYVSQTPASDFQFRSGIVPVRPFGRIVLPVKEPSGVRPFQCLNAWARHYSDCEIVIVFLPPDPTKYPDGISLGRDNLDILFMLGHAAFCANLPRHQDGTVARITFVNLATWVEENATEDDVAQLMQHDVVNIGGINSPDDDGSAKTVEPVQFITLEEYRTRVGAEQFEIELAFMRKGE